MIKGTEIGGKVDCCAFPWVLRCLKREFFPFFFRIHVGDEMADDELEDYAEKYDRRFQLAKRPRSLLAKLQTRNRRLPG
jgi:hypothetical protein